MKLTLSGTRMCFLALIYQCLGASENVLAARSADDAMSVVTSSVTFRRHTTVDRGLATNRMCIDDVHIMFDQSIALATIWGQVTAATDYSKKAFTLKSVDPSFRSFHFGVDTEEFCQGSNQLRTLEIGSAIRSVSGQRLFMAKRMAVNFPASDGIISFTSDQSEDTSNGDLRHSEAFEEKQKSDNGTSGADVGAFAPNCLAMAPCRMEVTLDQYNRAAAAMLGWAATERQLEPYSARLALLPLAGSIMTAFVPASRSRQYGRSDLIYILRRAAQFTSLLMPSIKAIGIADLSSPTGETPSVIIGGQRIFGHPVGSHRGDDADVSYITTGGGNDAGARYDIERNFWFLYAVLKSTSVDLVMTAYSAQFAHFAAMAYDRGLINETALARFESAKIMQDDGYNHDKHMHIMIKNSDNMGISRKFLRSDDSYSCYLALRRHNGGSNGNFCSTLGSIPTTSHQWRQE